MAEDHVPSREAPWVRVETAEGHQLDRYWTDPYIGDAEEVAGGAASYFIVENYPPNVSAFARPTKYRTEKDGTPATDAKGEELAERLDAAGLTEFVAGQSADEKRATLAEYAATHATDPQNSLEG